ncbi:MAG: rRNA adenine dimethyltransferase family protein, partial [Pseudomonadota bacterium]
MASPRRLLSEYGLAAKKNLGQNFLVDPNLARKIVEKAEVAAGDAVLEIGPGLGALTRPLLEKGARVTAVEVDQGLCRYLRNELAPLFPAGLTLVEDDILEVDLAGLAEQNGGPVIVVGNLPYLVSTPVLFKLLEARRVVVRAVLMFQRELAARLT